MEWLLYAGGVVYLIVAIITSWQCETSIAEGQKYRTLLIVFASVTWPLGLVLYYANPKFKELKDEADLEQLHEEEDERS
jgi:hypothetical protein